MKEKLRPPKNLGNIPEAESLCNEILSAIEPSMEDRQRIQSLAEKLHGKASEIVKTINTRIVVNIEGSFAKDTWIRGEADIDLFLLFPLEVVRTEFESLSLEIGEKILAPNKAQRRFAEHPYLETEIDGIRVNIVPAYKVRRGHWKSATDRTHFHTEYIKKKLEAVKRQEVRLLKQFMKGTGTYGSEIRVGGFSGYLAEIIILEYGSFLSTIENAAKWQGTEVIDIEKHYEGKEDLRDLFSEPLIVIDPIDVQRNIASAVALGKLSEFIAACRGFQRRPDREFFFPKEEIFSEEELLQNLEKRGTYLLFIHVGRLSITPDVLWGQLYRSKRAFCRILSEEGFIVLRSSAWSEEQADAILIIELEGGTISKSKTQTGPFTWSEEAERFIEKHLDAPGTVYGPWIEKDRWMVRVKRKHTKVTDTIRERIKGEPDNIGLGRKIQKAMNVGYRLIVGEEIISFYSRNKSFAEHLTRFLKGSPLWARR
jgi:tRNA nucleotidyltransferase (CCA-adding enzyme)